METEIEAKFLNINKAELRDKLGSLGAKLIYKERLMRRRVYEHPVNKQNDWVRVRDEGDKITLSYKKTEASGLHGTKELSLEVNDFNKACSMLSLLGLHEKAFQETKRELWNYEGVEITIDTWPWLETFVEIEGPTENSVEEVVRILDLSWSKALYGPVIEVYRMYFAVTEEEINNYPSMKFEDPAPWPALSPSS